MPCPPRPFVAHVRRGRIKVGLARKADEEAQARANVQRWEEALSESNADTDRQTVEREAVEKLEVLLKASHGCVPTRPWFPLLLLRRP